MKSRDASKVKTSTTTSLKEEDLENLRESGLSDETIEAMGCRSVEPREIKKLTGATVTTGGYLIPYRDTEDQTGAPYVRVRLRAGATPNGKRYVSGAGDDTQIYIPPTFGDLPKNGKLYVTEGEKKAAKAVQEGIPCVAIQGVWSSFDLDHRAQEQAQGLPTTRETSPLPRLLELAKGRDQVVVLGDSDLLSKPQARAGIETLAKSLRNRNIDAVAVYCPPGTSSIDGAAVTRKRGLDDWLLDDGARVQRDLSGLAFGAELYREGVTDAFNARFIARTFKSDLVYSRGDWHLWDGSIWVKSTSKQHLRLADEVAEHYRSFVDTLKVLHRRVMSPYGTNDSLPEALALWSKDLLGAVKEASKAADKIGGLRSMEAAFTVAQSKLLQPDDIWDRQPELLGVVNGVVDLRSGELLTARPDFYMTRTTGIAYDPEATCPGVDEFLERVQPEADMRKFLQTLFGYSATGHSREQKFYIFQGGGIMASLCAQT